MTQFSGAKSLRRSVPQRTMRAAAISCLLLLVAGCSPGETEEPEHHFPPHQPVNFQAAVVRMQQVHEEILAGPLKQREVKSSRVDPHAEEGHEEHSLLDPLEEMADLVRWLPELAADTDLEEAPWNKVHAASIQLEKIVSHASMHDGEERRSIYMKESEAVQQQLKVLEQTSQLLPPEDTPHPAGSETQPGTEPEA